jgi:hypothetical protein
MKNNTPMRILGLIPTLQLMLLGGGPSLALVLHRHGPYGLHMHAVSPEYASTVGHSSRYGHVSKNRAPSDGGLEDTGGSVVLAWSTGPQLWESPRFSAEENLIARANGPSLFASISDTTRQCVIQGLDAQNSLSGLGDPNPILHKNHVLLI